MKSTIGAMIAGAGILLAAVGTIITFIGNGTSIAPGALGVVL